MARKTQKERVIDYMVRFGSITTFDAFQDLGISKVTTRISELRRDGYDIIGEWETRINRYGEKKRIMRYRFPTR